MHQELDPAAADTPPDSEAPAALARRLLGGAGTATLRLCRLPTCAATTPVLHGCDERGMPWIVADPQRLQGWTRFDPSAAPLVVLSVSLQAPYVEHALTMATLLLRGRLHPLLPGESLQLGDPAREADLLEELSAWPAGRLFRIEPTSVWVRDPFAAHTLAPDAMRGADIDPVAADDEFLRVLAGCYARELEAVAEACLRRPGVLPVRSDAAGAGALPVAIDRHGMTLLCPEAGPPRLLRVPFHEPAGDAADALRRLTCLAACAARIG